MYYLCEMYYKPTTVQYYIADCVSWVPRLTLLDLRTCFWTGTHSYVGNLKKELQSKMMSLILNMFLRCLDIQKAIEHMGLDHGRDIKALKIYFWSIIVD